MLYKRDKSHCRCLPSAVQGIIRPIDHSLKTYVSLILYSYIFRKDNDKMVIFALNQVINENKADNNSFDGSIACFLVWQLCNVHIGHIICSFVERIL